MYRKFIENESVEVYFLGEKLAVQRPKLLNAPYWRNPGGPATEWKLPLDFKFAGQRITGEAYLLDPMKKSYTALNLFWRGRLLKGNIDPPYRPSELFGSISSWKTGRLCIELNMDAFKPTADRANIDFDSKGCSEDELLMEVRAQLSQPACLMLLQGENYRPKTKIDPSIETHVKEELAQVGDVIQERGEESLKALAATTSVPAYPVYAQSDAKNGWEKTFTVKVHGEKWVVTIDVGDEPLDFDWVSISETNKASKIIGIKLGRRHPFNLQYLDDTTAAVIIRLAAALAFAELAARKAGAKQPSLVRINMNEFLRSVLSEPLED